MTRTFDSPVLIGNFVKDYAKISTPYLVLKGCTYNYVYEDMINSETYQGVSGQRRGACLNQYHPDRAKGPAQY